MADRFVDTNVLLRFLLGDDPIKYAETAELFSLVEYSHLRLSIPDVVIAEAVFVLTSPRNYGLPRSQVVAMLMPLVELPNFNVDNRDTVLRALHIYGSFNIDFADAMIVASMEAAGATELYSYDTDFNRFPAIIRNPDTLT